MADHSHIEWTDATWNPITGCSIVSPGCARCYAMKLAGTRLRHHPSRVGLTTMTKTGPVWNGQVRFNEQWLTQPLQWTRARMIFVCAHGDLFHEDVPVHWIDQVFAVMMVTSLHERRGGHTYQVLTKRSARMRAYLSDPQSKQRVAAWAGRMMEDGDCWLDVIAGRKEGLVHPNIWLGVSAERQQEADARIPDLIETPAAVKFLSLEPLLGPIDFRKVLGFNRINLSLWNWWVIVGGESGDGARPMRPEWARAIRDQCTTAGVPFFFKQWGVWAPYDRGQVDSTKLATPGALDAPLQRFGKKLAGRVLDGRTWDEMPRAAQ